MIIGLFFLAVLAAAVGLSALFEDRRGDCEGRILYHNFFLRNDPATWRDWPPWGPPSEFIDDPRDIWLKAPGCHCLVCGERRGFFLEWGKARAPAICRACGQVSVVYVFDFLRMQKLTGRVHCTDELIEDAGAFGLVRDYISRSIAETFRIPEGKLS